MNSIAPQWIVKDLQESVLFYTETLGFTVDWSGSLFAILNYDGARLMLRELKEKNLQRPNRIPFLKAGWHTDGEEAWDAYVWVADVRAIYQRCTQNGVSIIQEIGEREYGNLDFEIEDPNGYILCFGQKS